MNILDIILLICLIIAVVQGLRKGFIAQVIAIASIITGVWLSARFATGFGAWIGQYVTGSEQVLRIVAFALILIAVIVAMSIAGRILEGMFRLVMLGWLNRLLGVAFSLLKSVLILGLIILAFNSLNATFNLISPEYISGSTLYAPIKDFAEDVFPYIKDLISVK